MKGTVVLQDGGICAIITVGFVKKKILPGISTNLSKLNGPVEIFDIFSKLKLPE